MVDFKLAPIKRYAKLAHNKASQQFISVKKYLFWCRKCKTGCCCCFTQNKFKRACSKVSEATRERCPSKFGSYELWKWLFLNVGQINFWLKSLKNTLEDVHVQLSCILFSCNFTKKTNYFFLDILSTIAEQHFCTRPLNGCLVNLQYHFWSQSQ